MLQVWIPNTLPLPFYAETPSSAVAAEKPEPSPPEITISKPSLPPQVIDENDNFPKGKIAKYFSYQGYGFITSRSGKEVYFNLAELDIIGSKDPLLEGMVVGYDASCTSHGLRLKKLKIY